jgi:hypothetical protein
MAIKERKQITGTEAQIKGFAGHNGVLAYATDTKHLHVLSGTAGTTTELANRADIPNVSGKADTTYVNAELAKKQNKGDYATTSALTSGLAGKANSSHTHTIANVTGLQDALNSASTQASNAIPKSGNRGAIGGYESASAVTTITGDSPDSMATGIGGTILEIHVNTGSANQSWTKVVYLTQNVNVILGSKWVWAGGKAPTIKVPGVLVFHWNNSGGIATHTAGAS